MRHTKAHSTGVVLRAIISLSPARPPNRLLYFKPPPRYGGPKRRRPCWAEDILFQQEGQVGHSTEKPHFGSRKLPANSLSLCASEEKRPGSTGRLRPANSSHRTRDHQLPGTARAEPPTGISHYLLLLQLRCFTIRAIKISYFTEIFLDCIMFQPGTTNARELWVLMISHHWDTKSSGPSSILV